MYFMKKNYDRENESKEISFLLLMPELKII